MDMVLIQLLLQFIFAGDLLYVAACYCSKLALAFFFVRLSDISTYRRVCSSLAIACCLFLVVSIMVLSFDNPVTAPWLSVASDDRVRIEDLSHSHGLVADGCSCVVGSLSRS